MVFTSNLGVATIIVEETMNLRGIMRVYNGEVQGEENGRKQMEERGKYCNCILTKKIKLH